MELPKSGLWGRFHMRGSENRGPEYSTLNSRILIVRPCKDPKIRKLRLLLGNSHMQKVTIYVWRPLNLGGFRYLTENPLGSAKRFEA